MRTNEIHASAKQVGRSSGRSSVAAAAYRSGSLLHDERTGLTHDYTRKGGVEHSQIFLPDTAPDWAKEAQTAHELREKLWNATEEKENRSNSTTAHELVVAFPSEFNAMQRREAGTAISQEIARRYNVAVDISYHVPSRDGDQRNYHAHILFATRGFDKQRPDGWEKTKFRDLSADLKDKKTGEKYLDHEGKPTTRGKLEVEALRKFTADEYNRIAERDRLEVRSEYLSFKRRGIDREPTQHMGVKAVQIENEGKQSRIGDANRKIKASNDNREALRERANVINLEQERLKRQGFKVDTPDDIRNDILEAIASKHDHFPFHKKQLSAAQEDLEQSRSRLENITLLERIAGKRTEYLQDIEAKEQNLENARFRMNELINPRTRGEIESGNYEPDVHRDNLGKINAKEAAELESKAAEYQKEQAELAKIEFEISSRSNGDKILGSITGKTREQKARIDVLRESVKSYEAKQRQYEVYTATQSREEAEFQDQKHKQEQARDFADSAQRMADNRRISDEFDDHEIHKFDRAPQALDEQNRQRDEEADYKERHKHDYDQPEGDIAKEDKAATERGEGSTQEAAEHDRDRSIERDTQDVQRDRDTDGLERE